MKYFYIVIGFILVVLATSAVVINHQDQLKQQALEKQRQEDYQKQLEQAQQAEAEKQAGEAKQKALRKKQLGQCIDSANKRTDDALNSPALANATPESAANFTQGVLQIQQTAIQDCQARYGE